MRRSRSARNGMPGRSSICRKDTTPTSIASTPPVSRTIETPLMLMPPGPSRTPIAPAMNGVVAVTSSRSTRISDCTRPNIRPRISSLTSSPNSVMPTTYATPAKPPTRIVATTARNRFGTSAMKVSDAPAPTIDGPNTRRRDRSPSALGPSATPSAMPRNIEPNSSPYAASPPARTDSANSRPSAMIAPPAARAPSMPTSSPRAKGVPPMKRRPSRMLASSVCCWTSGSCRWRPPGISSR